MKINGINQYILVPHFLDLGGTSKILSDIRKLWKGFYVKSDACKRDAKFVE